MRDSSISIADLCVAPDKELSCLNACVPLEDNISEIIACESLSRLYHNSLVNAFVSSLYIFLDDESSLEVVIEKLLGVPDGSSERQDMLEWRSCELAILVNKYILIFVKCS